MKKVEIFLLGVLIVITFIIVNKVEHNYIMEGKIDKVKGGEVFLLDETGNVWCVDNEGYKEGEKVKIWFDDNSTDEREDDIVKKIKKI